MAVQAALLVYFEAVHDGLTLIKFKVFLSLRYKVRWDTAVVCFYLDGCTYDFISLRISTL